MRALLDTSMRVNLLTHSRWSVYLLLATGILSVIWVYLRWPYHNIVKPFPLLCAVYGLVSAYLLGRERQRKQKLKEEIRLVSDDLTLQSDYTVDDFDLLYEVDELEQLISKLKTMPKGQRTLQAAVDAVEEPK